MITKVSIRNFKGISKCDINSLGNINLFIGKNDVCKSSILESIYYSLKEFTGTHLQEIIGRRTNAFFDARELWFNYNITKDTIFVTFIFDNDVTAKLEIGAVQPISPLIKELELKCVGIIKLGDQKSKSGILSIYNAANWKSRKSSPVAGFLGDLLGDAGTRTKDYISNCQFLDSSNKNDVNSIENLLKMMKSQHKDKAFNKYLQKIFEKESDTRIVRASQPGYPAKYRVAIIQNRNNVFVSGLGDGIRYGIQIIGTGLISRNTVLFIEEIESNQHPSSLKKLVDFLIEISIKNNLQLFITTHNIRAWKYFAYYFENPEQREKTLKTFHVKRNSTTGEIMCDPIDLRAPDQMRVQEALSG